MGGEGCVWVGRACVSVGESKRKLPKITSVSCPLNLASHSLRALIMLELSE